MPSARPGGRTGITAGFRRQVPSPPAPRTSNGRGEARLHPPPNGAASHVHQSPTTDHQPLPPAPVLLGYNTNGFAHHDLFDAIALLAEIGYRSVAITIDHGALSPREDWRGQLRRLKSNLEDYGMRSVIETGARFLLNPDHKHEPTLMSAALGERAHRMEFTRHAVRCAA